MGDDHTDEVDKNRQKGTHEDPTPRTAAVTDDELSEMHQAEADRQNSLLTTSQREYILGEHHPDHDTVFRSRLRDRVQHGLLDGLVVAALDPHDRDLIFHPQASHENLEANVWAGAVGMLQFLYEGLGPSDFADALEDGLRATGRQVEVSITERTEFDTRLPPAVVMRDDADGTDAEGDDTDRDDSEDTSEGQGDE